MDCIVGVVDIHEYYEFVAAIERRGFGPCRDPGAPICRRVYAGLLLDVMPAKDTPIGPSNIWYESALANAADFDCEGRSVRALTPIYFVATKIEAFKSRGEGDFLSSHDMEDLLTVLGGIESLRRDVAEARDDPGLAIRSQLLAWRKEEAFMDSVDAHFPGDVLGQSVASSVHDWIGSLA